MAITFKTTVANSQLDNLYDTLLGASPKLDIRSGAPAGPDNAAGGSSAGVASLPATAFAAASSKSKSKTGTWSLTATGSITAGHYRLQTNANVAHEEGTIAVSSADMTIDNTSITTSQVVTIGTFTRTHP
jgi:hypothetical protein